MFLTHKFWLHFCLEVRSATNPNFLVRKYTNSEGELLLGCIVSPIRTLVSPKYHAYPKELISRSRNHMPKQKPARRREQREGKSQEACRPHRLRVRCQGSRSCVTFPVGSCSHYRLTETPVPAATLPSRTPCRLHLLLGSISQDLYRYRQLRCTAEDTFQINAYSSAGM